jgi:ribose 5-phosphate isomerase B
MRIVIGSDHAGYRLKGVLINHLQAASHEVQDIGTHTGEVTDYPPWCAAAARTVVKGLADVGIVLGGSGQGEAMAANKVHGVRAALCHDEYTARLARAHNDANVLALGARIVADTFAIAIVEVFLAAQFEGGRHILRLAEISAIEHQECGEA